MTSSRDAPIGVFDSGVGGLTVLREIHERLPNESTIYLGDTARVPYGPKSPATIRRYAGEAASFLTGRGVKALVIACNTATAHANRSLADVVDVPVVGVVDPGAREAVEATKSGAIGVIGTRGTIQSGTYERAIHRYRSTVDVHSRACPLFVALAEEGWVTGDVAELTARRYLGDLLATDIDTLVLGCTHYPLLRPLLEQIAGPDVRLVDSAAATAREVGSILRSTGLAREGGSSRHQYFVTDDAEGFGATATSFLGSPVEHLERVDLDG